jgi:hypothetical protein
MRGAENGLHTAIFGFSADAIRHRSVAENFNISIKVKYSREKCTAEA